MNPNMFFSTSAGGSSSGPMPNINFNAIPGLQGMMMPDLNSFFQQQQAAFQGMGPGAHHQATSGASRQQHQPFPGQFHQPFGQQPNSHAAAPEGNSYCIKMHSCEKRFRDDIENLEVFGHNNQLSIECMVENIIIHGHNNIISGRDAQKVQNLIIMGHNNRFENLIVIGDVILQGHNNILKGLRVTKGIQDQGTMNSFSQIYQYNSSSSQGRQQQQQQSQGHQQPDSDSSDEEAEDVDEEEYMVDGDPTNGYIDGDCEEEYEEEEEDEVDNSNFTGIGHQAQGHAYNPRAGIPRQQQQYQQRSEGQHRQFPQQQQQYYQSSHQGFPNQGQTGSQQQQNFQFNFGNNTFQGFPQGSGGQFPNFGGANIPNFPDIGGILNEVQRMVGSIPSNLYPQQNIQMNFTGNTFNTSPQHHQHHHHQQYQHQHHHQQHDPSQFQYYEEEEDEEAKLSPEEIIDIINSYAAFKYEEPQQPAGAAKEDKTNCAICFENLKTGEMVKALPCSHKYHSKCINNWLKVKLKCPLCKQSLV